MAHPYNILLLGAGELGTAVLASLSEHPKARDTNLTVCVRPETLQSPRLQKLRNIALNVCFIAADLGADSVSKLANTLKAYDTVINCAGFTAGAGVQEKIAQAVVEAGVKRYIPWQFGVDYDIIGQGSAMELFDEQLEVRRILRRASSADSSESHTSWVIISTGMFTSFLFEPSFGVVEMEADSQQLVVHALGSLENRVTVTAVEDIGRLTAEIVLDSSIVNQVVYTAGDTISYGELADILEKLIPPPRRVKRQEWSTSFLKEQLKQDANDALRKYRVVFAEGKGVSWDAEQTINWQRDLETETVEDWLGKRVSDVIAALQTQPARPISQSQLSRGG